MFVVVSNLRSLVWNGFDQRYSNDPKVLDTHVWADNMDLDQTAPERAVRLGSTLFAILSASSMVKPLFSKFRINPEFFEGGGGLNF